MKKFQFRLEPVLKLRKYKERTAQMELAKALAALQEAQAFLEQSRLQEISAQRNWDAGLEKGMWENEFRMHADHLRGLKAQTARALENEARLKGVVEKRRRELVQASASRKSMELLREERFTQYKLETGRMEQKETDEMASLHRSTQERL
ncbi:flagellar FliJ protein [Desulfatibacillum alkenivorans DSM 16219]|jgi:flagellar FliJ protein|uniref:Flagellar FliJ protein n=1 Tax=Desulfatibacillum alkenivorans DSM 16219 TaxID=1121393 RepID=A0A1M6V469_9BACT|nr:flagellar export protein FliJ [Desulfatibacillum alkenivorans]SHK76106.1 flagellar FliJ protein [Desulfatibacillum alkenivorans DSM 16219]